ncbi:MAG: hypothetical protein P9M14_13825 [Candidatus Alcyoniella australis]|nr:hypothetical protein [Candidatus Alcyoniella australis]
MSGRIGNLLGLLAILLLLAMLSACGSASDDDDTSDDDDEDDDDDVADDDDDSDDDDDDDDDDEPFPACDEYGTPSVAGSVQSEDLHEISGLAISARNPGVLWAHNDSGDGAHIYAMTAAGKHLGVLTLEGAGSVDWEDMAIGPCGDEQCLYVADIGDNGASRTDCTIYRVVEPEVDPLDPFDELELDSWESFEFSYPDGPRDAESIAVHPDGTIYIVSKYPAGLAKLYRFPEPELDESQTLEYLGELDTGDGPNMTTAADIHTNGLRLLVRTYLKVIEWRIEPGMPFGLIVSEESATRHELPVALELQGEAIAYDPSDGSYMHVSEGSNPPLYRVSCQ